MTRPSLSLSRRSFLKLGTASLAAFGLTGLRQAHAAQPGRRPLPPEDAGHQVWGLGRVAAWRLPVREGPDRNADLVRYVYEDDVLLLLGTAVGGEYPPHNPTWYRLSDGYIHSSWVQPVTYDYQHPLFSFPGRNFLAQVSVPFVDARWTAHKLGGITYRLYFGAVFWVTDVQTDLYGQIWYRVWDERKLRAYFVPGNTLRRIPYAELTPLSPEVPAEDKRLMVDVKAQQVTAYEGHKQVMTAAAATGAWFLVDGEWEDFTTTPGTYRIGRKMPSRHMAAGDLAADEGFDLPGVPWVSYFSGSGMAFHGTYWHNDYGQPRSHGCVNVTPDVARWIYRWTTPTARPEAEHVWASSQEGTLVEVGQLP